MLRRVHCNYLWRTFLLVISFSIIIAILRPNVFDICVEIKWYPVVWIIGLLLEKLMVQSLHKKWTLYMLAKCSFYHRLMSVWTATGVKTCIVVSQFQKISNTQIYFLPWHATNNGQKFKMRYCLVRTLSISAISLLACFTYHYVLWWIVLSTKKHSKKTDLTFASWNFKK